MKKLSQSSAIIESENVGDNLHPPTPHDLTLESLFPPDEFIRCPIPQESVVNAFAARTTGFIPPDRTWRPIMKPESSGYAQSLCSLLCKLAADEYWPLLVGSQANSLLDPNYNPAEHDVDIQFFPLKKEQDGYSHLVDRLNQSSVPYTGSPKMSGDPDLYRQEYNRIGVFSHFSDPHGGSFVLVTYYHIDDGKGEYKTPITVKIVPIAHMGSAMPGIINMCNAEGYGEIGFSPNIGGINYHPLNYDPWQNQIVVLRDIKDGGPLLVVRKRRPNLETLFSEDSQLQMIMSLRGWKKGVDPREIPEIESPLHKVLDPNNPSDKRLFTRHILQLVMRAIEENPRVLTNPEFIENVLRNCWPAMYSFLAKYNWRICEVGGEGLILFHDPYDENRRSHPFSTLSHLVAYSVAMVNKRWRWGEAPTHKEILKALQQTLSLQENIEASRALEIR